MGGRGASSSGASLSRRINGLQKQFNSLGNRMENLVRQFNPRGGDSHIRDEYYRVQKKYNEVRRKINAAQDERAKIQRKREEKTNKRTFVNSYGEATNRYITSTTYERAVRRRERDVLNFLGRR